MKKLKLDELLVDSFPTSGPMEERGTVMAHTDQSTCVPKYTCTACESAYGCSYDCSTDPQCTQETMVSCDYTFCGECTNSDAYTCVGYC